MPTSPTTTRSQADEYAGIIAQELLDLDTVLSGRFSDDDNEDPWKALELDGIEDPTDSSLVLHTYLNETCLELDVLRSVTGSEHSRVEITRTMGGPSCYIARANQDGRIVEVTVHWAGDSATRRLLVPTLAEMLDDLADNWA